jgi:hypothetical protein
MHGHYVQKETYSRQKVGKTWSHQPPFSRVVFLSVDCF